MSDLKEPKKITTEDFDIIADHIFNEYARRRKARKASGFEDRVKEIDRQLRMTPDVAYKRNADGTPAKKNQWMPEVELPLQSQTLEILNADSRNMMFPENGPFFKAKARTDDAFLEKFKSEKSFILGSEVDAPSAVTSDDVGDYVGGFIGAKLREFDHKKTWDLINGEAFKYGVGVGRVRVVSKSVFIHDAQATYNKSTMTPILVPLSIKDVYLDDMTSEYASFGAYVGPAIILKQTRKLADLKLASKRKNVEYLGDGWIEKSFNGMIGDKNGNVTLVEYEGDLVVDNSDMTDQIFMPNVTLTVINGENVDEKKVSRLVRIQYNRMPWSSYIIIPYHQEHINDPYGGAPLMKGLPIQKSASESLNRLLQVAMLNAQPVVRYERDDQYFANKGGPVVFPGATWATNGEVEVLKIGDPGAMSAVYQAFLQQYSDVTGVNAPRLGAQTVSHTTAYAKDQEIQRGTVRTVDYVRSVLDTPMERWLSMCYYLGKEQLGDKEESVYMDTYNAYLNVRGDLLPDDVCFDVYGSGMSQEDMMKKQQRQSAIMSAIQLNQIAVQAGLAQPLNFEAITKQLLRDGGIIDVDVFTTAPAPSAPPGLQIPGAGEGAASPGALPIALQGLQRGIIPQ